MVSYTDGTSVDRPDDWMSRAACLGIGPELFFPVGQSCAAQKQTRDAIRVCSHCEVRDDCLDYALDNAIDEGIWGGMDEDERRKLRKRNDREAGIRRKRRQRREFGRGPSARDAVGASA
jgi:WhiB family transcriptional regulator, redox-sensing transcriptional regulator